MALTRKLLTSMALEAEKIDSIIEAHTGTVDGLKAKISELETKAADYDDLKKKYDDASKKLKEYEDGDNDWKTKFENEHKAFEDYKKTQDAEKLGKEKTDAYKKLLADNGVSEKMVGLILKATDFDSIEMEDGKIKDEKKHVETIKKEYADYIVKGGKSGADVSNPFHNAGGNASLEEIYKKDDRGRYVLNSSERQKKIADMQAQGTL